MITDDDLGSGTSNDRSRTEDEEILDELDEFDHPNNSSTTSITTMNNTNATTTDSTNNLNTHEFNQLMPPYSLYPLL